MAFLDALGKKITQTSQDVVQKTKDTAEVMKFTGLISDEERHTNRVFEQIGRLYFDLYSESAEEAFSDMICDIKQSQEKIKEYDETIKKIKGISYCPHCNSQISNDAAFCSTCGAKIEKETPPEPDSDVPVNSCPTCGSTMPDGYIFCANCGTKCAENTDITEGSEKVTENE